MTQIAQAPADGAEQRQDIEPFLTEVRYLEKTTVVAMSGDLTASDIGELRRLIIGLIDKERRTVVLDMGRLGSLDPSSVEVIIEARRYFVARGGDLILRAPIPAYFRVLAAWMRDGTFEIADAPPID